MIDICSCMIWACNRPAPQVKRHFPFRFPRSTTAGGDIHPAAKWITAKCCLCPGPVVFTAGQLTVFLLNFSLGIVSHPMKSNFRKDPDKSEVIL
jgi:hypothetical protein